MPPLLATWLGTRLHGESNIGICVFQDGSSWPEIELFQQRCQPGEQPGAEAEKAEPSADPTSNGEGEPDSAGSAVGQAVVGWYGRVFSLPEGAQYDDELVLHPEGAGEVGMTGATDGVEAEIMALCDKAEPGSCAHFWGRQDCGVPDANGCQLLVEGLRVDGSGEFYAPDAIEGWEGTVAGFSYEEPGAPQPDDAFTLGGDHPVQYGIDSAASAESGERDLDGAIATLRDSGKRVRIWGKVTWGVADAGGCRIEVYRIEDGGDVYELVPLE